jgi:hypothetical protein
MPAWLKGKGKGKEKFRIVHLHLDRTLGHEYPQARMLGGACVDQVWYITRTTILTTPISRSVRPTGFCWRSAI